MKLVLGPVITVENSDFYNSQSKQVSEVKRINYKYIILKSDDRNCIRKRT